MPKYYLSASGVCWDAMLKMTKIEPLKKVQEVEFITFSKDIAKATINI